MSYTFSHSIDNASSNFGTNQLIRASSDFDIRHNFQAAITYDSPSGYSNAFASPVLGHWGLDTRVSARSATPVNIVGTEIFDPVTGLDHYLPPDRVPGQASYLYGSQYPGGKIINYNAFVVAPGSTSGDAGRNFLRAFDAAQLDLAVRREFPIHERLHLQFRAEAFNLFNHPNFGGFNTRLSAGKDLFGHAVATLNNSVGGLNSPYQIGGPRSLQLMLKLQF